MFDQPLSYKDRPFVEEAMQLSGRENHLLYRELLWFHILKHESWMSL